MDVHFLQHDTYIDPTQSNLAQKFVYSVLKQHEHQLFSLTNTDSRYNTTNNSFNSNNSSNINNNDSNNNNTTVSKSDGNAERVSNIVNNTSSNFLNEILKGSTALRKTSTMTVERKGCIDGAEQNAEKERMRS